MKSHSCDECREIYRELKDMSEISRRTYTGEDATPQQLAAWLGRLDEVESARMRVESPLWKVWRRLQHHRTLTGHSLSILPLPPGSLSNPN